MYLYIIKITTNIMTTQELKSVELSAELTSRGIANHFSVSSTDYGVSCYFTFYRNSESTEKYIVRISDHSATNSSRIANERMEYVDSINIKKTADAVELFLFPERFEFTTMCEKATHRVNGVFGTYIRK